MTTLLAPNKIRKPSFTAGCWVASIESVDQQLSLIISTPKRVQPLACRRNMAKRVAREAWRSASDASRASTPVKILLRLRHRPTLLPTQGSGAAKKILRADCDEAIVKALRYLSKSPLDALPGFVAQPQTAQGLS
jgi:RNase P protein component